MSYPGGGQPPLPTPQTLAYLASLPGSRHHGKRWRTAAFFCDICAALFLVAAWSSYPPDLAATALVVGGVATVVAAVALWRSWRTEMRGAAIAWSAIALVITAVGAVA